MEHFANMNLAKFQAFARSGLSGFSFQAVASTIVGLKTINAPF